MVLQFNKPDKQMLSQKEIERLNLYPDIDFMKVLSNIPKCIIPWTDLISALNSGSTNPRIREIVILRISKNTNCKYALTQHTNLAKNNNISDLEIKIILEEKKVESLNQLENLLCLLADEIEQNHKAKDKTLNLINKHMNQHEISEIILLISLYCAACRFINSTNMDIKNDKQSTKNVSSFIVEKNSKPPS